MKNTAKNTTQKLVFSSLLAALICVATAIIKVPGPLGYIHLGDAPVILAAFLLPPGYGFLAAGIGSCLADLFSGYAVYAPVTFLIKGGMVLLIRLILGLLRKKGKPLLAYSLAGVLAELLMVLGYYVFEGILYGFGAALASVPFNAVQGVAGLALGLLLVHVVKKSRIVRFSDTFRTDAENIKK